MSKVTLALLACGLMALTLGCPAASPDSPTDTTTPEATATSPPTDTAVPTPTATSTPTATPPTEFPESDCDPDAAVDFDFFASRIGSDFAEWDKEIPQEIQTVFTARISGEDMYVIGDNVDRWETNIRPSF